MSPIELTDRDIRVLQTLRDHRVMTTPQLGELFFSGSHSRIAQRRLRALAESSLVDRFTPLHQGWKAPHHWYLSEEGARVLATRRGLTLQEFGYHAATQRALALNSHLGHITGLAQTYVCFYTSARSTPGARLQRWWPEARCRAAWGRYVRPDGYLRWHQNGAALDAFIEYDTGTEPLARVTAKIGRYHALAKETKYRTPVLFIVTGPRRLTNLCRAFATADQWVPVHVTTLDRLTHPGPSRPIWRQAADPTCAIRTLADLV